MGSKTPLATRIANACNLDPETVAATLDGLDPLHLTNPCWLWQGSMAHITPMMKHDGRPQPVRRVIRAAMTGQPLSKFERVEQACPNFFCVYPGHSMVRHLKNPFAPHPPAVDEPPSIDEVVSVIYEHDEPWSVDMFPDYPAELVQRAIDGILNGEF
jgi:hypothetical protein